MIARPARWFHKERRQGRSRFAAFLANPGQPYDPDPFDYDIHDTESLKPLTYGDDEFDGVGLQCEIISPKSGVGRNVTVYIRGGEVEWLMKLLKDHAIYKRKEAMKSE